MKALYFAAALVTAAGPLFAADVGVSLSIGQPGFYGQIDIGDYPRPQLIYRQPVMIERGPATGPPVYLHVPPGHAKQWRKHCGSYNACGERVYFVQNNWYDHEYVPRYQERQHGHYDAGRGGRRGDDRNDRGNERGNERGNDRGNDHGRGRDR